jgi:hypothetical protein
MVVPAETYRGVCVCVHISLFKQILCGPNCHSVCSFGVNWLTDKRQNEIGLFFAADSNIKTRSNVYRESPSGFLCIHTPVLLSCNVLSFTFIPRQIILTANLLRQVDHEFTLRTAPTISSDDFEMADLNSALFCGCSDWRKVDYTQLSSYTLFS